MATGTDGVGEMDTGAASHLPWRLGLAPHAGTPTYTALCSPACQARPQRTHGAMYMSNALLRPSAPCCHSAQHTQLHEYVASQSLNGHLERLIGTLHMPCLPQSCSLIGPALQPQLPRPVVITATTIQLPFTQYDNCIAHVGLCERVQGL